MNYESEEITYNGGGDAPTPDERAECCAEDGRAAGSPELDDQNDGADDGRSADAGPPQERNPPKSQDLRSIRSDARRSGIWRRCLRNFRRRRQVDGKTTPKRTTGRNGAQHQDQPSTDTVARRARCDGCYPVC